MATQRGPRDIAADLRAWTRAALASGRPPYEDDGAPCSTDPSRVVHDAMLRAAHACNSRHPMFTLPGALLGRILRFVDLHDRWSISQTCRHLRTRCLATPTLWQTIPIRGFGSLARVATANLIAHINLLAERSYPELLDIRVNYVMNCTTDEEAVVGLVLPLLPRLRYLELSHTTWNGDWGELRHILEGSAPALEETIIARFDALPPMQPGLLPSTLFSNGAGRLRRLELRNVVLPQSPCPALSTVRLLKLGDLDSFDIGVEEFCHLVALLPLMEELHLTARSFTWSESDIVVPSNALRRFILNATYEASNLERCLNNLPDLSHFSFSAFSGVIPSPLPVDISIWPHSPTAFLGMASTELVVHRDSPPIADPLTIKAASLMYSTHDLGLTFLSKLPLDYLTQLSIHEFYWASYPFGLTLQALRWLRIALGPCTTYRISGSTHIGVLSRWDLAAWDTPALETLVIAHVAAPRSCEQIASDYPVSMPVPNHCFCSKPMSVVLGDIHRFVTMSVQAAGQRLRLSHLMLQGIEPVDQDPWAQLILLQSIAKEVSISATAKPIPGDWYDVQDE